MNMSRLRLLATGTVIAAAVLIWPTRLVAQDSPMLQITDGRAQEGDGTLSFTVTLSPASATPVTVAYAFDEFRRATALQGADFVFTPGVLVFSPGETSRTFAVAVINDELSEGDEAFSVWLTAATGATISGTGDAYGFIEDDEPVPLGCHGIGRLQCVVRLPLLEVYNSETGTWQPGTGSARLVLTASGDWEGGEPDVRDGWEFREQEGWFADFGAVVVTSFGRVAEVIWESGSICSETFDISEDGTRVLREAVVTREMSLWPCEGPSWACGMWAWDTYRSSSSCWNVWDFIHWSPTAIQQVARFGLGEDGYRLGPATFDPEPSISIGDVRSVGEAGTVEFLVSLDTTTTARVTVRYSTEDGSAVAGADYVAADGTLTFEPGQLTKTIGVTILPDALLEDDETFDLVLSNPVGAHLARAVATGTIEDDDEGPLATLRLPTTAISGCLKTTGSLTLAAPAPAGGLVVSLSSDNPHAVVPERISFKPGVVKKSFPIATSAVATRETVTVEANALGQTISGAFTIKPMLPKSVTLSPTSVIGGGWVIGTVTLQCPAGPGDILVALSSSNPAVATPATSSVLIPAGVKAMPFDVTTMPVDQVRKVSIKTAANGLTRVRTLTVNPAP